MEKRVSIAYRVASTVMTPAISSTGCHYRPIGAGAPSRDKKVYAAMVGAIQLRKYWSELRRTLWPARLAGAIRENYDIF
jgi:hypothetical protein